MHVTLIFVSVTAFENICEDFAYGFLIIVKVFGQYQYF